MTGPRRRPICAPTTPEARVVVDEFMAYLAARQLVRDYEQQPEVGARAAFTRLRGDLERVTGERDQLAAALDQVRTVATDLTKSADRCDAGGAEYIALHTAAAQIRAATKEPK